MTFKTLFVSILLIFNITLFSQEISENIPASYKCELKQKLPRVEIKNIRNIIQPSNNKVPAQAGYTLQISSENLATGIWEETKSVNIWRLELYVPEASALNLYINKLHLSQGQELFIYSPGNSEIQSINSTSGSTICTDFITGDKVIIEYNTTKRIQETPVSISEIGVLLDENTRGFGDAGDCEVFVNCSEGDMWQNEKKGVARILVKEGGLTFWCTGSLINNTKNDGTPLFLTANHCGENADSIDYSNWLFYFNFESEFCGKPATEPVLNTISGSTLLANSNVGTSNESDFKLLKLSQNIPNNYKPHYNGWDRRNQSSPSGVTIHHPQGDLKMISTYSQPLTSTKYDNTTENTDGEYWMSYWIQTPNGHGVTEPGSSGCPLFNNEGNIVGALTGGRASCTYENQPDYYGKLSYSWDSSVGDSTKNLSYWLDPLKLGVTKLKGTNLDSTNFYAGFSAETTNIMLGEYVTFTNNSSGNIDSYSWFFEGGVPEESELENPGNIEYNNVGGFDVMLIATSGNDTDTLFAMDYIKVMPNIFPNPSNGKVKLSFGGNLPKDYKIRAFNSLGKEIGFNIIDNESYLLIDLKTKIDGVYLIKFNSSTINTCYTVIVAID